MVNMIQIFAGNGGASEKSSRIVSRRERLRD
jgi:hypothetical protein